MTENNKKQITVSYHSANILFQYNPNTLLPIIQEAKKQIEEVQQRKKCSKLDALFIYLTERFFILYLYNKQDKVKAFLQMTTEEPFLKKAILSHTIQFVGYQAFQFDLNFFKVESFLEAMK